VIDKFMDKYIFNAVELHFGKNQDDKDLQNSNMHLSEQSSFRSSMKGLELIQKIFD
jgi:t-SNARE complex subunit (syntaxin)